MVVEKLLIVVCTGAVLMLGCRQNGVSSDDVTPASVEGENFSFYTSEAMYDETQGKRSDNYSEPFEITDVWRSEGNGTKYLHVEVQHEKACDDQFEVIWDGRIAESYPPQLFLIIRLNAEDCVDLDSVTTDTLSIDLYEVTGDSSLTEEAIFNVSNASSSQDVNYDEPVSDSR